VAREELCLRLEMPFEISTDRKDCPQKKLPHHALCEGKLPPSLQGPVKAALIRWKRSTVRVIEQFLQTLAKRRRKTSGPGSVQLPHMDQILQMNTILKTP